MLITVRVKWLWWNQEQAAPLQWGCLEGYLEWGFKTTPYRMIFKDTIGTQPIVLLFWHGLNVTPQKLYSYKL